LAITHFAVEVQQIKSKQTNADLDVLNFDVFAFAFAQFLEWHQLARYSINSDSFGIQDEGLRDVLYALYNVASDNMSATRHNRAYVWELLYEVRIFLTHILRIPTENPDSPILQLVHLQVVNNSQLIENTEANA
jgi:hypothetical protein